MGARVEILYNPNQVIPPLKSAMPGESFMLQTGEDEFKAVISNEFIYQELLMYLGQMELLICNPLAQKDIRELASGFSRKLNKLKSQNEFHKTYVSLTKSRIKHEYHHLEQSLKYFANQAGGYTDFLHIHRLERAYRLGDSEGVLDYVILSYLNYCSEYLQTLRELDAIITEFQEDHLYPGAANKETILWRLSSVMKYMHQPDGLICDGFPHLKAMIVILTQRLDLADKNEFYPLNYDEIVPVMISGLRFGLNNPQQFLDQIMVEIEPQTGTLLQNAYLKFMDAHSLFMTDALDKNIIPDWK